MRDAGSANHQPGSEGRVNTDDWLGRIIGEQLPGVLFTPQQVELQFFSHKLIAYTDVTVQSPDGTLVFGPATLDGVPHFARRWAEWHGG
jgi:hypothetical protein